MAASSEQLDFLGLNIPGLNISSFLRYVENPDRLDELFRVQDSLRESPLRKEMVAMLITAAKNDPSFMALYESKYLPVFPKTEDLLAMPKDSFGQALGLHLSSNKIDLEFAGVDTSGYYKSEINEVSFLALRALRNHDAYHVLFGLSVSAIDECALGALQLAQFYSPFHATLLAALILHFTFKNPLKMAEVLEVINTYYSLGKKVRFLPGFKTEDHWMTPLSEVRYLVGIGEQQGALATPSLDNHVSI